MNTIEVFYRKQRLWAVLLLVAVLTFGCGPAKSNPAHEEAGAKPAKSQSIMLALLLDTSNSMDGLIEQAKSQLWKIVNELAAAKCGDGSRPDIKIALYEYGNDGLSSSEGYIRMVSPLTNDLDLISEKLFALRTNGGNEFCAQVINRSLQQLSWSDSKEDLKLIFIAGNEPFNQGEVPYQTACRLAREKGVIINTIFCGDFNEGVATFWKEGADLGMGTFMSIEQDRKTVYIESPYDKKISELNDRLNNTYIYYGQSGKEKKASQATQDANAGSYSEANKVDRAVSKTTHAYKNSSWDLVDASADDKNVVEKVAAASLPAELQGMTVNERKEFVEKKAKERKAIQDEIRVLHEKRVKYLAEHAKNDEANMLDEAMLKAIRKEAGAKNLGW